MILLEFVIQITHKGVSFDIFLKKMFYYLQICRKIKYPLIFS